MGGIELRKRVLVAMLCTLMLAATFAAGCGPQEQQTFINLATGGTAGTYYPLGGAMAEIWNNNIEGMNATAQSTNASVANVNLMVEGNADIIMVQNDIIYYAANGEEMFKDAAVEDIKGLCTLYPETIQIVTVKTTGITKLADLKGKRVAVGAAGSGTEANARQILAAAGITYDDITEQFLNFADAANSLKDGNVDAAFLTAGHPTAAVQDIAAQHNVVLIEVDDTVADALIADYPFYTKVTVDAGTYSGFDQAVKTVAVKAMLVTSSKLSEDNAYNMMKSLYENTDRIIAAHTVGKLITKETAQDGMSIELHPGAANYFSGN
ncbi:MAG: TAXI family TRAP transporter solute-binding subunit [bacterium]